YTANPLQRYQHQPAQRALFMRRVEWALPVVVRGLADCARQFALVAERFQMRWRVERSDCPQRVALFVSKYDHCLVDLLYRHQNGELACDIPLIISNHQSAKNWAAFSWSPFFPIPAESR